MKIFVGSIREHVTDQVLREHFSPYGQIDAIIHKGNYAFVFMPDESEGTNACQALHRAEILGCTINVENAKPSAVGETPVFSSQNQAVTLSNSGGGIVRSGTGNNLSNGGNLNNGAMNSAGPTRHKSGNSNSQGPVNGHNTSQNLNNSVGLLDSSQENANHQPRRHPKFHHIQGRIKLIIGNVGDIDKQTIEDRFSQYGEVHETFVMEGKGVAFVHVDEMKAEEMIEHIHNTDLNGNMILVSVVLVSK